MIKVKGNVVDSYDVEDLGRVVYYGEEVVFTDEEMTKSEDLKYGIASKFLLVIRKWMGKSKKDVPINPPLKNKNQENSIPPVKNVSVNQDNNKSGDEYKNILENLDSLIAEKSSEIIGKTLEKILPEIVDKLQQHTDSKDIVIDNKELVERLDQLIEINKNMTLQGNYVKSNTSESAVKDDGVLYIPSELKESTKEVRIEVDSEESSSESVDDSMEALKALKALKKN